jgi:hypothetical protein
MIGASGLVAAANSGVSDQNVDRRKLMYESLECFLDLRRVRYICRIGASHSACLFTSFGKVAKQTFPPSDKAKHGAAFRQCQRQALTDAARSTRYQNAFAFPTHRIFTTAR